MWFFCGLILASPIKKFKIFFDKSDFLFELGGEKW
jgi:hypothetical protein